MVKQSLGVVVLDTAVALFSRLPTEFHEQCSLSDSRKDSGPVDEAVRAE